MKRINKNVKFYINPSFDYRDHKLNVLKECMSAWSKADNRNLAPKFKEFEYSIVHNSSTDNKEVHVYEVRTTWNWLSQTKLFEAVMPLIESFGSVD